MTPAEAIDIAAQIMAAVEEAHQEQRARVEAEMRKLLDAKDIELQKMGQKLKAKEVPALMFPRTSPPMLPKASVPEESLEKSKHTREAPAPSQPVLVIVKDEEDEVMAEASEQADELEFVATERKPLIRASTTTPTAPRRTGRNGPPPPVPLLPHRCRF